MSSGYSQLKQGIYLIRLNFRVINALFIRTAIGKRTDIGYVYSIKNYINWFLLTRINIVIYFEYQNI